MRKLGTCLVAALFATALLVACTDQPAAPTDAETPLFAPADGNGNKVVDPFEFTDLVTCDGGEVISANWAGWGQYKVFKGKGNRNVELGVFHIVITYTNAAGDKFVWRDVGPDHWYVDDNGDLIVTITGRSTASGTPNRDEILVGHVVLNTTTNEVVFVAGRALGPVDDLACDALT